MLPLSQQELLSHSKEGRLSYRRTGSASELGRSFWPPIIGNVPKHWLAPSGISPTHLVAHATDPPRGGVQFCKENPSHPGSMLVVSPVGNYC